MNGSTAIDRLDAAALTIEELKADVDVVPDTLDAGDNGVVYFRKLADPSLLTIAGSTTQVVLTPPFEVWSHLAWSRRRLVMVSDEGVQAVVMAVDPEPGRSDAVFTTHDRIDSVWTDIDGTALLIAHAPYPETDNDAGSTLTLIRGDQQTNVTLARLHVATTASMSPDLTMISFVESNTHRLGSLAVSDGTLEWMATDLDGAEISAGASWPPSCGRTIRHRTRCAFNRAGTLFTHIAWRQTGDVAARSSRAVMSSSLGTGI